MRRIRTRVVRIEGEDSDNKTTTAACHQRSSFLFEGRLIDIYLTFIEHPFPGALKKVSLFHVTLFNFPSLEI